LNFCKKKLSSQGFLGLIGFLKLKNKIEFLQIFEIETYVSLGALLCDKKFCIFCLSIKAKIEKVEMTKITRILLKRFQDVCRTFAKKPFLLNVCCIVGFLKLK
jgi:hypothetical protein